MPSSDVQHHVYAVIKRLSKPVRKNLAHSDWMVREEAEKALTVEIVNALEAFELTEKKVQVAVAPSASDPELWCTQSDERD